MRDFLEGVRRFREYLLEVGVAQSTLALPAPRMLALTGPDDADPKRLFAAVVTEDEIVAVSRDLFASGHFSLAIQEAFKALEKYVQSKSGISLAGSSLMDQAFSPKSPSLAWSSRKTQSQIDEHAGYHRMYAGAVIGIRNPCAHEFNWVEDDVTALELLMLVQHLLRKARLAQSTTASAA